MSKKILTLDNVPVINKKIGKIDTIEKLKASTIYSIGDVVEVLGFHTKGDGSHHKRIAKAEDDGSGEQGQNGIWWCIVHSGEVNVSWFGAKFDISYNLSKAKENYYIVQRFFDYALKCKKLIFDGKGVLSLIGTVYLNTENSYLLIEKGCDVKGKYNEGDNGVYYQSGAMLCVGKFVSPKPPFDFHRKLVKNITIELNGTLETIYDNFGGTLTKYTHNNNCVGVASAYNVKVFGSGGVVGSDWKGICFDTECWGCTLILEFIENCYAYTWNMSGDREADFGVTEEEYNSYKEYINYVSVKKNIIDLSKTNHTNFEAVRVFGGNLIVEETDFYFKGEVDDPYIVLFRVHDTDFRIKSMRVFNNKKISNVFRIFNLKEFSVEDLKIENISDLVYVSSIQESKKIKMNKIQIQKECFSIINNNTNTELEHMISNSNFKGITTPYEIVRGTKSLSTSVIYSCEIDYSKISIKKRNNSLEESCVINISADMQSATIPINEVFNRKNATFMVFKENADTQRSVVTFPFEILGITNKDLVVTYQNLNGENKKITIRKSGDYYIVSSEIGEKMAYGVTWG